MKLKELPYSVYHSSRLKLLSLDKLSGKGKPEVPIIVSLTTIPDRIDKVYITIRNILDQTVKPEKIILWLRRSQEGKLPQSLKKLIGEVFEVRFFDFCCSHKKLVHSLEKYPSHIIVTCDDDFIYSKDWLELLYKAHKESPKAIVANRLRMIQYDNQGNLEPYKKWVYNHIDDTNKKRLLIIGASGVLYPPNSLDSRVFNESLIKKLAPKADDIWFTAMALLNGTEIKLAENNIKEPIPVAGTQHVSLKKENITGGKNEKQWLAVSQYFNLKIT